MVYDTHTGTLGNRISVLRWRKSQREFLALDLAKIESSIAAIEDSVRRIRQEQGDLLAVIRSQRQGELSIEPLLNHQRYESHLVEVEKSLLFELDQWLNQASKCRNQLMKADLELKKIEKLVAQEREKKKRKVLAFEQKIIDEFASIEFWKREHSQSNESAA